MARTSIFDLTDRLAFGGTLAEQLGAWRAAGLSYRDISLKLRDEHDIDVTDETVRTWIRERVAA